MAADERAVVLRSAMPVPALPHAGTPLPPKPKRKVLDEETYVGALETIIQRDFFPDLAKLRAQHAYLSAVESNDFEQIQAVSRRYVYSCHSYHSFSLSQGLLQVPDAAAG